MYSSHFCGMQICTKETCLLSRPRPVRPVQSPMQHVHQSDDGILNPQLRRCTPEYPLPSLDRCFALRDLIRMERISCWLEKSGILNVSTEFRYLRCTEIFWNSHNVRSWNLGTYGPSYIAHSQVPRPTLQCQSGNQTTLHTSATSKQPYKRCMGIW